MMFEVPKSAASRNLELSLVMLAAALPIVACLVFLSGTMLKMSFVLGVAAICVLGAIAAFASVMSAVFFFRAVECILDVQEMSMHIDNAIVKKMTAMEIRHNEDKE